MYSGWLGQLLARHDGELGFALSKADHSAGRSVALASSGEVL
jgi:hypothetical protein